MSKHRNRIRSNLTPAQRSEPMSKPEPVSEPVPAVSSTGRAVVDHVVVRLNLPMLQVCGKGGRGSLPMARFDLALKSAERQTLCDLRDGLRAAGIGGQMWTHKDAFRWLLGEIQRGFDAALTR